jgi:hypothetical protein
MTGLLCPTGWRPSLPQVTGDFRIVDFLTLWAQHNCVSSCHKIMRSKRTHALPLPKPDHLTLFLIAGIDLR